MSRSLEHEDDAFGPKMAKRLEAMVDSADRRIDEVRGGEPALD